MEGVPNPDKLSADIASQCATTFNTPLRVEISTEMLEGKPVVVVFVPEAAAQDKPIYFKSTGLPKGAYRRIGSTDQRCTDDDLEALYQSRQREAFDAGIVSDAELSDFDESAIAEYRQARAEANPTPRNCAGLTSNSCKRSRQFEGMAPETGGPLSLGCCCLANQWL